MFKQWMRKKTLKYPLLWLAFACLTAFSLVACGGSSSSGSPPTPTISVVPSPTPTAPSTSTPPPTLAAFKVTSIDMAVSPSSIAGLTCGSNITVTYTATFHIVPNSPGGTIEFLYTWNGGHASPSASVTAAQGQTTATYAFTWQGQLSADHVLPGYGSVMTTSPNQVQSPQVKPDGMCT